MSEDELRLRLRRVLDLLDGDGPVNELFVAPEVEELAAAGSGLAAVLAATIAAAGFGRTQDWRAALDWLAIAAARGEENAKAQMRLLGGADIAAWTAARPLRVVSETPRIGVVEGFADRALCDWLIASAAPLQEQARVYSAATGSGVAHGGRSNTEASFGLTRLDLPLLLLRERIANTMGVPVDHCERTSVFRYQTGQTFAPHMDYLNPASDRLRAEIAQSGQRVMTFLIYLNDAFEGGETHFLDLGLRLRGAPGDAVFFHNVDAAGAPDPATRHEGAPPTSGEKWLLSQFIRDKSQPVG